MVTVTFTTREADAVAQLIRAYLADDWPLTDILSLVSAKDRMARAIGEHRALIKASL